MEDIGIDANGTLANLSVLNKIANLPYEQRLIAADTFAEQIYPAIVEELSALGHKVATPAENIARYNQGIQAEKANELREYYVDTIKEHLRKKRVPKDVKYALAA